DAHGVGLAPHLEERSAAKLSLRSALGVVDEIERRAAALLAVIVPSALAHAVRARAVGVPAVPAKLFLGAAVWLAPELHACGLAQRFEVGQVHDAASRIGQPRLRASQIASARAPSRSPCSQPFDPCRTSQPPPLRSRQIKIAPTRRSGKRRTVIACASLGRKQTPASSQRSTRGGLERGRAELCA